MNSFALLSQKSSYNLFFYCSVRSLYILYLKLSKVFSDHFKKLHPQGERFWILHARDKKFHWFSYMQSIINYHNIKNFGYTVNSSNPQYILTEVHLTWHPESLEEFPVSSKKRVLHQTDSHIKNDRCFLKLVFYLFISCWNSRENPSRFSPSHFPFSCSILAQHHRVTYCSGCSKITFIPSSLVYCCLALICIYCLGNGELTIYGTFWAPSPIAVGRLWDVEEIGYSQVWEVEMPQEGTEVTAVQERLVLLRWRRKKEFGGGLKSFDQWVGHVLERRDRALGN